MTLAAAPAVPPPVLDDAQRAAWARDGFLAIERLIADEEVRFLGGVCDRIVAQRLAKGLGKVSDVSSRIERGVLVWLMLNQPESQLLAANTTWYKNARAVAAQLLDVKPARLRTELRIFFKPPRVGAVTPWHQDESYHDPRKETPSVNVWVPMDEATVESGCLQYIPGSHQGGVRLHRRDAGDPMGLTLMTDDVDASRAVPCPLPAGGATVHHCRTLHSSGRNSSDKPRRAFVVICEAPSRARAVPVDWPWVRENQLWPDTNV